MPRPWSSAGTRSKSRPTGTRRSRRIRSGGVFDELARAARALLPQLVDAFGLRVREGPGYEADDFLAAAVARPRRRGGTAVVPPPRTGTAFQLASDRTTILQPVRGVQRARRGSGPAGGAGALRRRAARRCRTSSPCAAIPPTAFRARLASGRRRRPTCLAPVRTRSRRRSRPGGSRRSQRTCGSTVESASLRRLRPTPLPSKARHLLGRRRPPSSSQLGA